MNRIITPGLPHVWVPKFKITDVELPIPKQRFSGHFRLEAFKANKTKSNVWEIPGTRRVVAEFDNMVVNQGLNYYGAGAPGVGEQAYYCSVGTGNTAEDAAQTALVTPVAIEGYSLSPSYYGSTTSAPYYGYRRYGYRFDAGFGGGAININEIGVGSGSLLGTPYLSARALTKDEFGIPATVSVLADEFLDVYYTRKQYAQYATSSGGGSVKVGATTYTYTVKAAALGQPEWGKNIFSKFNFDSDYGIGLGSCHVYGNSYVLGAVTSAPTGGSSNASNFAGYGVDVAFLGTYSTGSYTNSISYYFDLDHGNVTGGIKCLVAKSTMGAYQFQFSSQIPKTSSNIMSWVQQWTWGRYGEVL